MLSSPTPAKAAPHQELLYRQLAGHYGSAIEQGALPPGSRMPSVRELMLRHQVSLSTGLQALRWMEEQGQLEARPRVGYFVRQPALARLPAAREPSLEMESPTDIDASPFSGINPRISLFLEKARQADVKIDLGTAMPAPELFDAASLNRLATALLREQPNILLRGATIRGTHPEFQAAMARHALDCGVRIAPEEVMATLGNSEAVNLALAAVTQPGDIVAVESPTFFGLLQGIETQGLRTLEIPSSPHTGISLEALELAVRSQPRIKAVIVVPHLQMPTGCVMPDSHKQRLLAFCTEHDLALIEDDIYRDLVESTHPARPIKAWDTEGQVIYCASFNKTFAPGLRQGWMNAGRWHTRVQMLKYARTRNMQSWSQLLAARGVSAPSFDRRLRKLRSELRTQREASAQAIASHFPPGVHLSLPPGGLSLWLELPDGASSTLLHEQALARGIRIAPGPMFSNSGRYERFIRLSCGMPFSPAVEQAYVELGQLIRAML
ncbi:aminotransferase class I/II-fold pyridoxal phosphate-dependent enzyme [Xylophilus rhododendri]|uniref:Aminotransferase class I/II-fold pyridoxal phosphate-dependent enzyme n=1 Tax=Xylophilus rhododendri TaxID=2697032 RepID=A0A857J2Q9_9BURK|nr:PLP-dependent aminotransferase family protein [Xylophilus rhododendri]QHI97188.1 aminotransferase class I/II-fold pyridoxal phosphate-dependent enzyme [Xylophilus rhododendri]